VLSFTAYVCSLWHATFLLIVFMSACWGDSVVRSPPNAVGDGILRLSRFGLKAGQLWYTTPKLNSGDWGARPIGTCGAVQGSRERCSGFYASRISFAMSLSNCFDGFKLFSLSSDASQCLATAVLNAWINAGVRVNGG
jgi:hypothetical protein